MTVVSRQALLALVLVLGSGLAQAVSGNDDRLWRWLTAEEAASGAFEQRVYDEQGELLERSSGHYAILRPGYFRWEIEAPDRQLLLVAADTLWHYDLDLATATRRSTAGDQAFAPLQLLGGDVDELRRRFAVEALDDEHWRLRPTWPQAGFQSVVLGWQDALLTSMRILDRSGQRLDIDLRPERPAPALKAADFHFDPPPDVDVFIDEPS